MQHTDRERTLAVAAVFQSAVMTQQLAREGATRDKTFQSSIQSIFEFSPEDTESALGGLEGVRLGLKFLASTKKISLTSKGMEIMSYVMTLIQLAAKFEKQQEMKLVVSQQLETIAAEAKDADVTNIHILEKLAELYKQTISTLMPRVMVNGEHGYLSNELIAAKVRSSLFAGMRAAILWRQIGGRRWHFLVYRGRMVNMAEKLLTEAV